VATAFSELIQVGDLDFKLRDVLLVSEPATLSQPASIERSFSKSLIFRSHKMANASST
jgi:hypothetical protein